MRLSQWKNFAVALLTGIGLTGFHHDVLAGETVPYIPKAPSTQFTAGVDFLIYTRDVDLQRSSNLINGPDAGRLRYDSADFDPEAGFRAFLSWKNDGMRFDVVYSEIGEWSDLRVGQLSSGLSFDEGLGTQWAGGNSISPTTLFSGLHQAATGTLGGEADEFDGLSPSASFPGDAAPVYALLYESELATFELNAFTIDEDSPYRWDLVIAIWSWMSWRALRSPGHFEPWMLRPQTVASLTVPSQVWAVCRC